MMWFGACPVLPYHSGDASKQGQEDGASRTALLHPNSSTAAVPTPRSWCRPQTLAGFYRKCLRKPAWDSQVPTI